MVEAVKEASESGPVCSTMSVNNASDPDPDIGRMSANGNISVGIPSCVNNGAAFCDISARKPEACNMPIATYIPTIKGMILTTVSKPVFPPDTKLSNISTRLNSP